MIFDYFRYLIWLAILPVIYLCSYVYGKDTRKEPRYILKKFFVLGIVSTIFASIMEKYMSTILPPDDQIFASEGYWGLFINVLAGVGIIEELCKYLIILFLGYRNNEFDQTYDIVVYSVYTSLGFACFENLLYSLEGGIGTALMRMFTAVPGHACFAVIMGYYFSKAKVASINGNPIGEIFYIALALIIPSILHAFYDSLVMAQNEMYFLIWIVYVVVLFVVSFKKVNKLAENNMSFR